MLEGWTIPFDAAVEAVMYVGRKSLWNGVCPGVTANPVSNPKVIIENIFFLKAFSQYLQ